MIPPSHLPPADSLDGLTATTSTSESDPTTLVCSATWGGVRCAPHWAQRFATARCYVAALIALSLLLGCGRGYLAELAHLIGISYGLPDIAVDILVVGAETVQGVTSLFVAHGGARAHRPSWLGAPAFLHAGACFAVLVPFAMYTHGHAPPPAGNGTNEWLCEVVATVSAATEVETCWTTLVTMVLLLVSGGVAWAALLTHGITYLDDNVDSTDVPALLGALLGADRLGYPLGQILAFLCSSAHGDVSAGDQPGSVWWIGWPVMGAMLMVTAVLISSFPRRLPSAAVRERANLILESVCRRVRIDDQPLDIDMPPGLVKSFKRVLKNRFICAMTLFLMFVYAPLHFFSNYQNRYLESVYFIPEPQFSGGVFKDQWTSRVTTGFLKPPIVLMTMLLSGLIIARKRPKPSTLAMWNVIMAFIMSIIFFSFIFLRCPLQINGLIDGSLDIDARCNSDCSCSSDTPFLPICDRYGINTYYSPCHAGCTTLEYIDDIKLYNDCKCLKYERRAKEGACSSSHCSAKWVAFQSLVVLVSGLAGSCLVGSILLCLRSVAIQDKVYGLAFVVMHIGATHLPGRFLYKVVTDATCIYWGGNYNCQLFDPASLAIWFNVLNGCLFLLATLFALLAWRRSNDVKLFINNFEEPGSIELNEIRQKLNARLATPFTRRKKKDYSTSDAEESDSHRQEIRDTNEENQTEESEMQPLRQRTENNVNDLSENNEQDQNPNHRVWSVSYV